MSGWGCPHEDKGVCTRLNGLACDPGMKGCILHGRFRFANEAKNRPPPGQKATDTDSENLTIPAPAPRRP
ncbi:MAG TPA: hypothetical protein VK558_11685 [Patescibacteria group bacterium]|nr:hypothetical protein [Patescibacteria group bacterium]